jgi:hypothetical protein
MKTHQQLNLFQESSKKKLINSQKIQKIHEKKHKPFNPAQDCKSKFVKIPISLLENNNLILNSDERSFLFFIFSKIDEKTGFASFNLSLVAKKLNISRTQIYKAKKSLEDNRYIFSSYDKKNDCTIFYLNSWIDAV